MNEQQSPGPGGGGGLAKGLLCLVGVLALGLWFCGPSGETGSQTPVERARSGSAPGPGPQQAAPGPRAGTGRDRAAITGEDADGSEARPPGESTRRSRSAGGLDDEPPGRQGPGADAEGWHSRQAAASRDQRSIAPDDPDYDPVVEARQLFFPLEEAPQAARPLTPSRYKGILTAHKDTSAEVFTRAGDLLRQGEPDAARELLAEWNRLYLVYKDETYPEQARPRETLHAAPPAPSEQATSP